MARKYPKNVPVPKATDGLRFPVTISMSRVRKVISWMLIPFAVILATPLVLLIVLPYQLCTGESIFDRGRLW